MKQLPHIAGQLKRSRTITGTIWVSEASTSGGASSTAPKSNTGA
jgi:hypothetical protein